MTEDRADFGLEGSEASLVALDGFRVILQADATLVRQDDDSVTI